MKQDEIIEMARQAGLSLSSDRPYSLHGLQSQLFELVKLVDAKATARERVACFDAAFDAHATTAVLEAIRARGEA